MGHHGTACPLPSHQPALPACQGQRGIKHLPHQATIKSPMARPPSYAPSPSGMLMVWALFYVAMHTPHPTGDGHWPDGASLPHEAPLDAPHGLLHGNAWLGGWRRTVQGWRGQLHGGGMPHPLLAHNHHHREAVCWCLSHPGISSTSGQVCDEIPSLGTLHLGHGPSHACPPRP